MSITINKFLEYLKEYSKVSSKDLAKMSLNDIYEYIDRQAATQNFIRLFSIPPDEWNEYVELYYEFDILSKYLLFEFRFFNQNFYNFNVKVKKCSKVIYFLIFYSFIPRLN